VSKVKHNLHSRGSLPTTNNPKIIVICGPTATGKTNLALNIANHCQETSIISIDSRQAYQMLDILTGKDIPNGFLPKKSKILFQHTPVCYYESGNIRLWGIDLLKPDQDQNLSDFVKFAWAVIEKENQEDRQIILVGGTGLYLKGIVDDLDQIHIPQDPKLRSKLDKLSTESLKDELIALNSSQFEKLNHSDQNNPRRLIRQIEIALSEIKKVSIEKPSRSLHPEYLIIGLETNRDKLKEAITARVKKRLSSGALTEVKTLLQKFPNPKLRIYTSLGVNFLVDFLNGQINQDILIENWSQSEFAYAKRQIIWFKKQKKIIWYDKDVQPEIIIKKVNTWFKKQKKSPAI
jgi:tRNA dimethylallyltransferase